MSMASKMLSVEDDSHNCHITTNIETVGILENWPQLYTEHMKVEACTTLHYII